MQDVLQGADATPTSQAVAVCADTGKALRDLLTRWEGLTGKDVKAINEKLGKAGLPLLGL